MLYRPTGSTRQRQTTEPWGWFALKTSRIEACIGCSIHFFHSHKLEPDKTGAAGAPKCAPLPPELPLWRLVFGSDTLCTVHFKQWRARMSPHTDSTLKAWPACEAQGVWVCSRVGQKHQPSHLKENTNKSHFKRTQKNKWDVIQRRCLHFKQQLVLQKQHGHPHWCHSH